MISLSTNWSSGFIKTNKLTKEAFSESLFNFLYDEFLTIVVNVPTITGNNEFLLYYKQIPFIMNRRSFKYNVHLSDYGAEVMENVITDKQVFPFHYQNVVLETFAPKNACIFCGEPLDKKGCSCAEYKKVMDWINKRYTHSSIEIMEYEVVIVSASSSYCHRTLVDDDRFELANPMKVKVDDFDYCTRIHDEKPDGDIMLSQAWEQDDSVCFFTHREGLPGVHLVRIEMSDLNSYPVYHIKWKAGKATYEMDVEHRLTPDDLIQQLSAVRLPA